MLPRLQSDPGVSLQPALTSWKSANGSSRLILRTSSQQSRYLAYVLFILIVNSDFTQKIVYPYAWGEYNVLILPPSFPYGGMENPIFTFATPSIISKVRSIFCAMVRWTMTNRFSRTVRTLMLLHTSWLTAGVVTWLPMPHGSISG